GLDIAYVCSIFVSSRHFGTTRGRHDLDLTIRRTSAARASSRTDHALANAGRLSFGQQTGGVRLRGVLRRLASAVEGRRSGGGRAETAHYGLALQQRG
ncbi:MAG: hypothetical protein OXH14_17565, partial [Alphaproteobacteria bacterium]|nr:hypothetical protein [Alphaproteobacteria bacterium]